MKSPLILFILLLFPSSLPISLLPFNETIKVTHPQYIKTHSYQANTYSRAYLPISSPVTPFHATKTLPSFSNHT
ncbi:hypothetical protein DL95DRAFT_378702, partial [Leptodontidium sp. 2 PMI_412]